MKLKELKHNHSLTDLLKVLIFSILMITPLLSVATRCLYVICNKNAYQSAEITQTTYNAIPKYQTNEVTQNSDFVLNNYYVLEWECNYNENSRNDVYLINDIGTNCFKVIDFTCNNSYNMAFEIDSYYIDYLFIYTELNVSYNEIVSWDDNDDVGGMIKAPTTNLICDLLIQCVDTTNIQVEIFNYFNVNSLSIFQNYIVTETQATTLDNVFEYSVNKLAESPILSWTQQTAIYTGVSTMTAQLGVSSQTIPMLIVYWFLLTVIYIIIDIIIKLFTWLTHMIGSKSV